jgi:hypothetical protein
MMKLKFPIDKKWPKRSFLQRWAARVVAKMLLSKNSSYQCCGKINWMHTLKEENGILYHKLDYVPNESEADIQVPSLQMAHWILRESGYSVCEADIEKRIKAD